MDRNLDCVIKQEPQDPVIPMSAKLCQPVPIKLEDLDGIGKYPTRNNYFYFSLFYLQNCDVQFFK